MKYGYKLQFSSFPVQYSFSARSFSSSALTVAKAKVTEFLSEGALSVVQPSEDQFLSHIFPVPKRTPGEYRIILDLSDLNTYIRKITFRMDNFHAIMALIARGDFFISIDLTDAYHAIAIHPLFRKFLTFIFLGVYYQYNCLPQGLTSSPRIFTKVMKAVLTYFRSFAIKIAAWLDDFFLSASSAALVSSHADFAIKTFRELGFVPNLAKSQLEPVQRIQHVGLVWDSVSFTVSIPEDKILAVQAKCQVALSSRVSIKFLSSILGSLEFFRWGCPVAALHYRGLQRNIIYFLARNLSYYTLVSISEDAKSDLDWWTSCGSSLPSRSLSPFSADFTLFADASNSGWGAWCLDDYAFGRWSEGESDFHINIRELLAVLFAFQSLFRSSYNCSILVQSDNSTVVAYINKQGGTTCKKLCDTTLLLWQFCVVRDISLAASHVPGIRNGRADKLSRLDFVDHDYSLSSSAFESLSRAVSFSLEVDLFASRLNNKLENYVSWHADPFSSSFNAFSLKWQGAIYLFPPLPLIDRVLSKFVNDNVSHGLLICPYWPSQPWFSTLLSLLIDFPLLFSSAEISDPSHLLPRSCRFLGWPIGSQSVHQQAFLRKLPVAPSRASPGTPLLGIRNTGENSVVGVVSGKLVMTRFL